MSDKYKESISYSDCAEMTDAEIQKSIDYYESVANYASEMQTSYSCRFVVALPQASGVRNPHTS